LRILSTIIATAIAVILALTIRIGFIQYTDAASLKKDLHTLRTLAAIAGITSIGAALVELVIRDRD
jgi:hypothetical protein